MTDWREALQDAMYPVLTRLLQEGCVLPLFVTCIGPQRVHDVRTI